MKKITRRTFVATGVMGLAAISVAKNSGRKIVDPEIVRPIRLGVIGTGNRGAGLISLINDLKEFEVVACCDVIRKNLEVARGYLGREVKEYMDYKLLLDDVNVEAVLIATPLNEHYRMAADAIDAGKHVYVEKTMTYSVDEALKLEKKVLKNPNLVFQVGYQYRYYGLYHAVLKLINSGYLGQVRQFECQYHRNSDWRKPVDDPLLEKQVNWRMYRAFSGGLMAELCSHQIDVLNWFVGEDPVRVAGVGGIDYWKDGRETNDNVRALFEYPNGIKASVSSILSNAYKGYSMRVLGSEATVEILQDRAYVYKELKDRPTGVVDGVTGATITSWGQGEGKLLEFEDNGLDPTVLALLDFAKCIRDGLKPFADVEVGRRSAIAVHLANKSIDTRRFVEFEKDNWV